MTATTTFEPGVYAGIPDDIYHADRSSLSSTGARTILKSPALFRWQLDNPSTEHKTHLDLGKAVHTLVLGFGAEPVEVEGDRWNKAQKEQREKLTAEGKIALLTHELAQAKDMAAAVLNNELAKALLRDIDPELSLWWNDPITGRLLRCRPDATPPRAVGRRLIVSDLKTSADPGPKEFPKSVHNFGYHMQAPFYLDGLTECGLDDNPAFMFIAVGKTPPYLVAVHELHPAAIEYGRSLNRRAIDLWDRCIETGDWPSFSDRPDDQINQIDLPRYAYYETGIE